MAVDEQQVPFFGTPVGFASTIKMRRLKRMMVGIDPERVVSWGYHMRDLAKVGRVMGEFTTDVVSFVESYGGKIPSSDDLSFAAWVADCVRLWDGFDQMDLVEIDGNPADLTRTFRVVVVDFAETNVARAAARPRAKTYEERKRDDAGRKRRAREAQHAQFLAEWGLPSAPEFVYALRDGSGRVKIGRSAQPARRAGDISGSARVVAVRVGGPGEEQAAHECLAVHRLEGEWFKDCAEVQAFLKTWSAGSASGSGSALTDNQTDKGKKGGGGADRLTLAAMSQEVDLIRERDWSIPSGFEDAVAPALREVPLSSPSRGTTPVGAGEAVERDPDSSGHADAASVSKLSFGGGS